MSCAGPPNRAGGVNYFFVISRPPAMQGHVAEQAEEALVKPAGNP
jgi:hypothetical protein